MVDLKIIHSSTKNVFSICSRTFVACLFSISMHCCLAFSESGTNTYMIPETFIFFSFFPQNFFFIFVSLDAFKTNTPLFPSLSVMSLINASFSSLSSELLQISIVKPDTACKMPGTLPTIPATVAAISLERLSTAKLNSVTSTVWCIFFDFDKAQSFCIGTSISLFCLFGVHLMFVLAQTKSSWTD